MVSLTTWIKLLPVLSDWRTSSQSFSKGPVSLSAQSEGFSSHPLPMSLRRYCVGFQRPGGFGSVVLSSFSAFTPGSSPMLTVIADNNRAALTTQDGHEIGIYNY